MKSKKVLQRLFIALFLTVVMALSVSAYSVDLYGTVSGLDANKEYTAQKYSFTSDVFGASMALDSETKLESGVWKISASGVEDQLLFVECAQSGHINFWNTTEGKVGDVFAGSKDTLVPGKWTINTAGAYKKIVSSSMRSDTIPTVCIHFDKTKVVTPVEGGNGYAYATPIKGESNLLQESTFTYAFSAEQIVPANRVISMTFPTVVIRTGGMAYTSGYSLADAKGLFTFTVKVPGAEGLETYSVETNVDEYGELIITAPEAMKASKGYVIAMTYAPYANAPDEIYSSNWDTSATSYVHIGLVKGENKLNITESTYPAPTAYDGFGVIGVDGDRTYEIAEAVINADGSALELGTWTPYVYSAQADRDLAGLYAVREVYNGKTSNYTLAYAWGDAEERRNILDLNEAGTHLATCTDLATYDRTKFYHAMWSGDISNSTAFGKYGLFGHGQVSVTNYYNAKTAYLADPNDEAAKTKFESEGKILADGINKIKIKYAFDNEGVINTSEAKSLALSFRCDNTTLITTFLTTKIVAYVADRSGKITTYEIKNKQDYAKFFSYSVNFEDFLPEEGWLLAFDIYPNVDVTPDQILEVDTGNFRYPLTLSENSYTINAPKELPISDKKPDGLVYEGGVISGLDDSKAYEYAQFDINGIHETDWTIVSGITEFVPEIKGLIAVKYSGDGYSHSGSAYTYVYVPGNKMYSIINTTPTLNYEGTATIDVLDVATAGSFSDARGKIVFNEGKWTGLSLSSNLALRYGFDRLVLGCSGTPLHSSLATAMRDAADDTALNKARANAADASADIYYSYAYKPDEIVAMSNFESFKFKVTTRQTGFALVGTIQTKFVFKVVDDNDALVDRVVYKDVNYTKAGTVVTVTAEDFTDLSGYIVGMIIYPYEKLGKDSYFDYEDSDSGDYAVYLYEEGYKVNVITPAQKPVLSISNTNAIITVDNYNENVTYAYSDNGEDWTTFEGDSFKAVKASTDYTVKALGNAFFLESEISDAIKSPAVTVAGISLVLDGTIGIKVYMDIDTQLISDVNLYMTKINDDYKDYSSQLEYGEAYRVGGGVGFYNQCDWATKVTLDPETELYSTVLYVAAKDVDNVRFECDLGGYYIGEDSRVAFGNLGGGVSFDAYVASAKELALDGDAEFIKALGLIESLENYTAYADNYFNGGALDAFESDQALESVDKASRTGALEGAEFYGTSLILEESITIRHYFKVDDLEVYDQNYTSDIPYTVKDGYICYDISDISAQDMGELKTLTIKNGEDTAYEIKYSVANYLKSATDSEDIRLVSLVNAMKEYYASAFSYANPKPLYVKYDAGYTGEQSVEGLHFYIPTEIGYIDHVYGHTVVESRNADIWRLSLVYMCDDNLANPVQITTVGEWDMALMISGRPDFIGGHAHGDEITTDIKFILDGVETDIKTLAQATEFKTMVIIQDSIGYDPLDGVTPVLKHHKEHKITHAGIRLDQTVEWLGDYTMSHSYLAMMPPSKAYTDSYYTNLTPPALVDLSTGTKYVDGATSVTVYGSESGLYFTMTVNEYDTYIKPYMSIADNGGGAYNKMYFTFVKNGTVSKGDVWETMTVYRIEKK